MDEEEGTPLLPAEEAGSLLTTQVVPPPKGGISEEEYLLLAPLLPQLEQGAGQGWQATRLRLSSRSSGWLSEGMESVGDKGVRGGICPLCGSEVEIPAFSGF